MLFDQAFGGLIPGARGAALGVLLRTGTPLTGRQIHRLVAETNSLRAVQDALRTLHALGLVSTETVGRSTLHTVNQAHYMVAPLRMMLDPIAALKAVVATKTDESIRAVILFGSVARGTATDDSDIDLALITETVWDGQADLAAAVRDRLGCPCDVLAFTTEQFISLADRDEPVVLDIIRDGIMLSGSVPGSIGGRLR